MEAIAGNEPHGRSSVVGLQIHFENSDQQMNGLVLDTMKLVAQRLPFINMKNFPDIALRVGPYELVPPRFVDYFSFVGDGVHCQGVTITDSQGSENVCAKGIDELSPAAQCANVKMSERGDWIEYQPVAVIITLGVQDPKSYELPPPARAERMYSQ
jgi:hypothetical protein